MPASTTPVVRTSLTEPLLNRYNQAASIANVGGGSAKDVGTEKADVVTVDDQTIQAGFVERQPAQVTEFTDNSLNYSTNVLKLDNSKYAPSGRH